MILKKVLKWMGVLTLLFVVIAIGYRFNNQKVVNADCNEVVLKNGSSFCFKPEKVLLGSTFINEKKNAVLQLIFFSDILKSMQLEKQDVLANAIILNDGIDIKDKTFAEQEVLKIIKDDHEKYNMLISPANHGIFVEIGSLFKEKQKSTDRAYALVAQKRIIAYLTTDTAPNNVITGRVVFHRPDMPMYIDLIYYANEKTEETFFLKTMIALSTELVSYINDAKIKR